MKVVVWNLHCILIYAKFHNGYSAILVVPATGEVGLT